MNEQIKVILLLILVMPQINTTIYEHLKRSRLAQLLEARCSASQHQS